MNSSILNKISYFLLPAVLSLHYESNAIPKTKFINNNKLITLKLFAHIAQSFSFQNVFQQQ